MSRNELSEGARKLRAWRIENGKTQKNVGDALGVYSITVGSWERGDRSPELTSVVALEKLTDGFIEPVDWTMQAAIAAG
jgi:DNA-binding XRE family transcriptional regulator